MLAGPMIVGIVASISVSLADAYFIGKLGTIELAAISFCFPVIMAIMSLAIGLGAGTGSIVSRAVGANRMNKAKRLATDSVVLASILVVLISVLGYLTIEPLFILLGASHDALPLIVRFMRIWYFSMPFLVIPMVANAVIRAVGDAFWPSLMMVCSSIINIILTPILIFGWGPIPAYHIEGAAWGTLIAYVFSLLFASWLLIVRERMIEWSLPVLAEILESWKQMFQVAIPAAVGNAVNPVGIAIVTAMIANFGEATVAGFGVATRIESFAVIPMLALSAVIGPVVGQNWGAQKIERVLLALKQCFKASLIWSVFIALVFWLSAPQLAALFSSESAVQEQAISYLYVVPISVFGYGWSIVAAGAFNAIGKSVTGLASYLIRVALLYVPLSTLAALYTDSQGVFIAISIANGVAGLLLALVSFRLMRYYFAKECQNSSA